MSGWGFLRRWAHYARSEGVPCEEHAGVRAGVEVRADPLLYVRLELLVLAERTGTNGTTTADLLDPEAVRRRMAETEA